jgi:hypothetical protein
VLSSREIEEIEYRLDNLSLELLPRIVNVDVPRLIEEVKALQSVLFVRTFLQGGIPHGGRSIEGTSDGGGSPAVHVGHVGGEGGEGVRPVEDVRPGLLAVHEPEEAAPAEAMQPPAGPDSGGDRGDGDGDQGELDGSRAGQKVRRKRRKA